MNKVRYVEHKEFRANVQRMIKYGGSSQRAALSVQAMFGRISIGEDPFEGFQVTNHGESRIDKCVKYDLAGRSRLITVQDDNLIFLLYFGGHEDADKWLERHKDIKFSVSSSGVVSLVPASASKVERITLGSNISFHAEQLYTLFSPPDLFDRVLSGASRALCREVERLTGAHSEDEIFKVVSELESEDCAKALYDALVLVRSDNVSAANDRLKLYLGIVVKLFSWRLMKLNLCSLVMRSLSFDLTMPSF